MYVYSAVAYLNIQLWVIPRLGNYGSTVQFLTQHVEYPKPTCFHPQGRVSVSNLRPRHRYSNQHVNNYHFWINSFPLHQMIIPHAAPPLEPQLFFPVKLLVALSLTPERYYRSRAVKCRRSDERQCSLLYEVHDLSYVSLGVTGCWRASGNSTRVVWDRPIQLLYLCLHLVVTSR
jgi:hypothetical protein